MLWMPSTDRARRLSIATVALLAFLVITLSVSGQVSAHLPIYESGGNTYATAFKIPDISTSYGIFAQFELYGPDVQYYRFDGVQGHEFYCSLSIPSLDYLKRFAPDLALIGPGLQAPDAENASFLEYRGIVLPAGDGMMRWVYGDANNSILPAGTPNQGDFEPFTQTVLWARQEVTMPLPATGVFYVLVFGYKAHIPLPYEMPISYFGENDMKFVLAPGRAERFGIGDYMRIPVDWIETRLYWNENPLVFLSPALATVIIGLVERWRYLRTRVFQRRRAFHDMTFFLSLFTISGCLLMIGSGVNQLAYIVWNNGFTPQTSVVLVMLAVGALLGATGIWQVGKPERMRNWVAVVFALIMAFVALVIGAGFLVGPLIFLSGTTLLVVAGSKNRIAGTSGT